jgi:hypothetical protein
MASSNPEADDFSLELFTGDDCNFSDLESDPDPTPKSEPRDVRLCGTVEGFNNTDDNVSNASPEKEDPVIVTTTTTTVTNTTTAVTNAKGFTIDKLIINDIP